VFGELAAIVQVTKGQLKVKCKGTKLDLVGPLSTE
jgi:hypothetical protein